MIEGSRVHFSNAVVVRSNKLTFHAANQTKNQSADSLNIRIKNLTEQINELEIKIAEREKRNLTSTLSKGRFNVISNHSLEAAFSVNVINKSDFKLEWISPCFEKICGFNFTRIFEQSAVNEHVYVGDRENVKKMIKQLTAGQDYRGEIRLLSSTGDILEFQFIGHPIINNENELVKFYGVCSKSAEEKSELDVDQELTAELKKQLIQKMTQLSVIRAALMSSEMHFNEADELIEGNDDPLLLIDED